MIKIFLLTVAVLAAVGAFANILFSLSAYEDKETGWFLLFNVGFLLNMWWLCSTMERILE